VCARPCPYRVGGASLLGWLGVTRGRPGTADGLGPFSLDSIADYDGDYTILVLFLMGYIKWNGLLGLESMMGQPSGSGVRTFLATDALCPCGNGHRQECLCYWESSCRTDWRRTLAPLTMSWGRENSWGAWLMPLMLGMKIMPMGARRPMLWASWVAPLGSGLAVR
jgi:hypothetical protein